MLVQTCPNCKKPIDLIPSAERNLESYHVGDGQPVLATSKCCGKAFKVWIQTSFRYDLYEGDRLTDDWGNKIK